MLEVNPSHTHLYTLHHTLFTTHSSSHTLYHTLFITLFITHSSSHTLCHTLFITANSLLPSPPPWTGRTESGPVGVGMRGKLVRVVAGRVSSSPPPLPLGLAGQRVAQWMKECAGTGSSRGGLVSSSPPPLPSPFDWRTKSGPK